jgi:curli biogenesis system outer membrane secretion channel CsgG
VPLYLKDLESSVAKSFEQIKQQIPVSSRIVIFGIITEVDIKYIVDFVTEELTEVFIKSKLYKIVDRDNIDLIRAEQQFQLSGEVDDSSMVEIGKFIGANIIVTGKIVARNGNYFIILRVLDVKTSELLSISTEMI